MFPRSLPPFCTPGEASSGGPSFRTTVEIVRPTGSADSHLTPD